MATSTTRAGLVKPALTEAQDVAIVNSNMDAIDGLLGATQCTSGTRPVAPFIGQLILETDTGKLLFFSNTGKWTYVRGTEVVDTAIGLQLANAAVVFPNSPFPAWPCDSKVYVDITGFMGYCPTSQTIGLTASIPALTGSRTYVGDVSTAPAVPSGVNAYIPMVYSGVLFIPANDGGASGLGFSMAATGGVSPYTKLVRKVRREPIGTW